jgi:hypothetical protein
VRRSNPLARFVKTLNEAIARDLGNLWRRRIEDGDDRLRLMGERLLVGNLILPPRKMRRDEVLFIRIDGKMSSNVIGTKASENE